LEVILIRSNIEKVKPKKFFKFKSLNNIEHVFDIIQKERLYCSSYDNLNDPFEGLFFESLNHFKVPTSVPYGFDYKFRQCQSIKDFSENCGDLKICSLSSSIEDVLLWSHYADGHKGIAIEINFENLEGEIHKVTYDPKIPFSERTLLTPLNGKEILTKKTIHWKYEKEYRVINEKDFFEIADRIQAIYLGTQVSDFHKELLRVLVPIKIPIYFTKLNTSKISVEQGKLFERKQ
jgi:hypothetical protein